MIGCSWTRARKQPIIRLYFQSENELKFYNLEASIQKNLNLKQHSICSNGIKFDGIISRANML